MTVHLIGEARPLARALCASSACVPVAGLLVVLVSLTSVVHLDLPTQDHFSLHFHHGLFALFLVRKLYETVALRDSGHWVTDHLGLHHRIVDLFEGLQQHGIRDFAIQVSNVHLVLATANCLKLRLDHLLVGIGPGNSSSMRGPVQFEYLVAARDSLSV